MREPYVKWETLSRNRKIMEEDMLSFAYQKAVSFTRKKKAAGGAC